MDAPAPVLIISASLLRQPFNLHRNENGTGRRSAASAKMGRVWIKSFAISPDIKNLKRPTERGVRGGKLRHQNIPSGLRRGGGGTTQGAPPFSPPRDLLLRPALARPLGIGALCRLDPLAVIDPSERRPKVGIRYDQPRVVCHRNNAPSA